MEDKKVGFLHDTMLGMTFEEIEQSVARNELVLIPVGVVEEHGPQLPLGTDIYVAMAQAEMVLDNLHKMNVRAIIAPPFYLGGMQAMTRQFAGSFTSSKSTIVAVMLDYLSSLDRFGYKRAVLLNYHGDRLHVEAMVEAIKKANDQLTLKTYWPEYVDDVENDGFDANDDFLALIPPFENDRFATVHTAMTDPCDWHAGAYETAVMMELYPDEVHKDRMVDLPATNLHDEQIQKWANGEKEDRDVVPHGYCGDPMKAFYVETHCEDWFSHIAKGLKEFFKL